MSFYRYIDKKGPFSTENPPIKRKNQIKSPKKAVSRSDIKPEKTDPGSKRGHSEKILPTIIVMRYDSNHFYK